MPGASSFCSQIAPVIRINRCLERYPSCNLDARLGQAIQLGRVICQQHNTAAAEYLQHPCSDTVVTLIVVKAERQVGVNGIESIVLHLISAHLVCQTKPTALLRKIKNNATA